MDFSKTNTLIFDFDGTLADSFALVMDISYELTGMTPVSAREVRRLRKLPLLKAVREVGIPLWRIPRLLMKGRGIMLKRMAEVRPFPAIPESLRVLHEQGKHLLVISSNSEQNVREFLRSNNLEQYFDGVYGGAGILDKSAALRRVMRRNTLDVTSCCYVGDEVRDATAAKKVGMAIVSVGWGYQDPEALAAQKPDALLHEPKELLQLFQKPQKNSHPRL